MTELRTIEEFHALEGERLALVYKHSARCPISLLAHDEVEQLQAAHPDVPVFLVDVLDHRALAQHVARHTGVVHQSPQLILLAHGAAVWAVSHFDVRKDVLAARLAKAIDRAA